MISNLKNKISNNKQIVENFSYLSLAQLFNMLFPVITYPYLLKVLGTDLYGEVVYAQVIATYFIILVSFGFNVSGAKEIAINREDKSKLNEVFSIIMGIKTLFFVLSFIVFVIVLMILGTSEKVFWLYLFSFFICLNDLLFPQWFFQGIEKIKYTTIVNVLIKVLFLLLIFILIKDKSDYLLVPILNVIGIVIGGIFALYVVFVKEKIRFTYPKIPIMLLYAKKNLPLFLSDIVISIKDRFSIIFIGHFLGMGEVAIYDFGVKIMSIFMALIGVVNNAVFPKMSIERDRLFLKRLMKYSFIFCSVSVLFVIILLPYILGFVNKEVEENVLSIQILLLSPILMSLSLPLARNGLVAFDKYRLLLVGMLFTSIFYLLCIGLGYALDILNSVLVFTFVTVAVYGFELLYRVFICKKEKII